ncbi:MAG: HAD family phosphatase [Actinobacteria bacterium]|nr:HAD family phosphatase [Actinomycetota bacterium]
MKPRLLALDVDGTLTAPERPLDGPLAAALEALAASGVVVVLATGRGRASMRAIVQRVGRVAYCILNNGSVVRRVDGDRVVRARHLALGAAEAVVAAFRRHRLHAIWIESPYAGDRYLVDGAWWDDRATQRYLTARWSYTRPLLQTRTAPPPVEVFAFGDSPTIATVEAELGRDLRDQIATVSWWSERIQSAAVEVLPAGVSKGEALAWLAAELDIKREAVVAVGDDRNDREMLQWAGFSVALAGAPADVQSIASRVMANTGEPAVRTLIRELWGV